MNRQLVAFLSMFSLVLVLSIYYVMLPSRTKQNQNSQLVNVEIEEGSDPYFATLLLEQKNEHEEIIATQYEIVASSDATNAEKAVALEVIASEQKTMKNENELRDIIIAMGKPSCFVEIKEDEVYVLTVSETKSMQEVAEIIFSVQDFLKADLNVLVSFH